MDFSKLSKNIPDDFAQGDLDDFFQIYELSEREKAIIYRRMNGETFAKIGKEFDITGTSIQNWFSRDCKMLDRYITERKYPPLTIDRSELLKKDVISGLFFIAPNNVRISRLYYIYSLTLAELISSNESEFSISYKTNLNSFLAFGDLKIGMSESEIQCWLARGNGKITSPRYKDIPITPKITPTRSDRLEILSCTMPCKGLIKSSMSIQSWRNNYGISNIGDLVRSSMEDELFLNALSYLVIKSNKFRKNSYESSREAREAFERRFGAGSITWNLAPPEVNVNISDIVNIINNEFDSSSKLKGLKLGMTEEEIEAWIERGDADSVQEAEEDVDQIPAADSPAG